MVESGIMEPDAPELRDRLVALRSQRAELDRDIARLQENLKTGELDLSPLRSSRPSRAKCAAVLPRAPDLRQAYMKLLPDTATIDHHGIRREGSPAVLERLASRGPQSKSSPEVLSLVREWRPREDSNLRPPV